MGNPICCNEWVPISSPGRNESKSCRVCVTIAHKSCSNRKQKPLTSWPRWLWQATIRQIVFPVPLLKFMLFLDECDHSTLTLSQPLVKRFLGLEFLTKSSNIVHQVYAPVLQHCVINWQINEWPNIVHQTLFTQECSQNDVHRIMFTKHFTPEVW